MKPIRLPVIRIDRKNNTVYVKSSNGEFPCKITNPVVKECILLGDDAVVVKSAVSGEWLCVDYRMDTPTNYAIHNSYLTNYDEMICDERGVPYE